MKEGHKLRAHINTASLPASHSPHFPWPGPRSQPSPLGIGSGHQPGTLLSFPAPSLLSGRAHEMTLHVSRWQRWACEG